MVESDLVSQSTREKIMSLSRPGESLDEVIARLADTASCRYETRVVAVYEAAIKLIRRLDTITTAQFAFGGERTQREALRSALVQITEVREDADT